MNPRHSAKRTDTEDENWLLDDSAHSHSAHCDDADDAPSQFALICDNVQLDVASHRSLLGDLGRILQSVLGLAASVTHRADYQASTGTKVSR